MPSYEDALGASGKDNERRKAEAMEACAEAHLELMACFKRASIFNGCVAESRAFWECYERHRGFQKTKLQAMIDRAFPKGER